MKLYAEKQLSSNLFESSVEDLGFTLPERSVNASGVASHGDIAVVIVYSAVASISYFIFVVSFIIFYYKK